MLQRNVHILYPSAGSLPLQILRLWLLRCLHKQSSTFIAAPNAGYSLTEASETFNIADSVGSERARENTAHLCCVHNDLFQDDIAAHAEWKQASLRNVFRCDLQLRDHLLIRPLPALRHMAV